MKYCPKCETRYDDDTIRFCTKDGSPLIAEEEPKFVEMPSEAIEEDLDDPSERTVVRRNVVPLTPPAETPASQPVPPSALDDINFEATDKPRIVVPAEEEAPVIIPPPRPRRDQAYDQPRRTNTAVVVLLTVIGTSLVLGCGGLLAWLFLGGKSSNVNGNANTNLLSANQNLNLNSNLNMNVDSGGVNFNFNTNFNTSLNTNLNANANKSPTPTKTPTPSPSPTASPDEGNVDVNLPTPTPRPSSTTNLPTPDHGADRTVSAGVLNGRATNLATPSYPPAARAVHAEGTVNVEVLVDEDGRVISARAVSGNPLLRQAAETAARNSRIAPSRVNGENVKTAGVLVYTFREN